MLTQMHVSFAAVSCYCIAVPAQARSGGVVRQRELHGAKHGRFVPVRIDTAKTRHVRVTLARWCVRLVGADPCTNTLLPGFERRRWRRPPSSPPIN